MSSVPFIKMAKTPVKHMKDLAIQKKFLRSIIAPILSSGCRSIWHS